MNCPRANHRSRRLGRSIEETSIHVGRPRTNCTLYGVASFSEQPAPSSRIWRSSVQTAASASIETHHS